MGKGKKGEKPTAVKPVAKKPVEVVAHSFEELKAKGIGQPTAVTSNDMPDVPDVEEVLAKNKSLVEDVPKFEEAMHKNVRFFLKFEMLDPNSQAELKPAYETSKSRIYRALFENTSPVHARAAWKVFFTELLATMPRNTIAAAKAKGVSFSTLEGVDGFLIGLRMETATVLAKLRKDGYLVGLPKEAKGVFSTFVERHWSREGIVLEHEEQYGLPLKDGPSGSILTDGDLKEMSTAFQDMQSRVKAEMRRGWQIKRHLLREKYGPGSLTIHEFAAGKLGHILLDIKSGVEKVSANADKWLEGGTMVFQNAVSKFPGPQGKSQEKVVTYLVAFCNDADERCFGMFESALRKTQLIRPPVFTFPNLATSKFCPTIKAKGKEAIGEARYIITRNMQRGCRQARSNQSGAQQIEGGDDATTEEGNGAPEETAVAVAE